MSAQEFALEITGDPAHHVEWSFNGAGGIIVGFSVRLLGYAATETSGSASANVDIYDATDHAGQIVLPVRLAQGESAESWYGTWGIWFKNGLYINVSSGQAKGSLFFRHIRL